MRNALLTLMIAIVAVSGGVHLGVLQTFAWAKMVAENSREQGVAEAIDQTFSGEHPCALCHLVDRAAKDAEKKAPKEAPPTKVFVFEWLAAEADEPLAAPPQDRARWRMDHRDGKVGCLLPEVPPPRRAV